MQLFVIFFLKENKKSEIFHDSFTFEISHAYIYIFT